MSGKPTPKKIEIVVAHDTEFKSFLEPAKTPGSIKPPQASKTSKHKRNSSDLTQTNSTNFSFSHQSSPKNQNLLSKNQILADQTEKIRKKVIQKKTDSSLLFKTQAVQLNKEELMRINKENPLKLVETISEDLQTPKTLVLSLLQLSDFTTLKSIRYLLTELYEKLSKVSIEVTSKVSAICEKYEKDLNVLKADCEKLRNSNSVNEKELINSLIEKNLQLSSRTHQFETIEKQQKEQLKKLEQDLAHLAQISADSLVKKEEKQLLPLVSSTEDHAAHRFRHDSDLKEKIIHILEAQLKSKDSELVSLRSSNSFLKSKVQSHETQRIHNRNRSQCTIHNPEPNFPSNLDFFSYFSCLALALEDHLK